MSVSDQEELALMAILGKVVAARREKLGLSQEAIAERSRLTRNFVSLIECGDTNPSVMKLRRLAQSLELPLSKLLKLVEQKAETKI